MRVPQRDNSVPTSGAMSSKSSPHGELWIHGQKIPPHRGSEEPYPFHWPSNKRGVALTSESCEPRSMYIDRCQVGRRVHRQYPHPARIEIEARNDDSAHWDPRLIYAYLTGFGEKGLGLQSSGFDTRLLGASGWLSDEARFGSPPTWPVAGSGDNANCGGHLCRGVTGALSSRTTGKGSYVTSLLAAGVWSSTSLSIRSIRANSSMAHDRAHPANAALKRDRSFRWHLVRF